MVLAQGLSWGYSLAVGQGHGPLKLWVELGDLFSRWLTHMPGKFVQVVGRTPLFPAMWASMWDWLLQSTWPKGEQDGSRSAFRDWPLEVTLHHFGHISFVKRQSLSTVYTQGREINIHEWEEYQRICGHLWKQLQWNLRFVQNRTLTFLSKATAFIWGWRCLWHQSTKIVTS